MNSRYDFVKAGEVHIFFRNHKTLKSHRAASLVEEVGLARIEQVINMKSVICAASMDVRREVLLPAEADHIGQSIAQDFLIVDVGNDLRLHRSFEDEEREVVVRVVGILFEKLLPPISIRSVILFISTVCGV